MHSIGISAVYNCTLTTTKKEMEEDFVVTVTNEWTPFVSFSPVAQTKKYDMRN